MQKTKNSKKENTKEFIHVKINKPIALRKEILKTAINTTKLMQTYSGLTLLRQAKKALIEDLRTLRNDIVLNERQLQELLPKLPEEQVNEEQNEIHKVETLKEDHDIEKLKKELFAIESKLKELS